MRLRAATPADVDDIVELIVSHDDDPSVQVLYPHCSTPEYREEWKYRVEYYLRSADDFLAVVVLDDTDGKRKGDEVGKVVAYGMWTRETTSGEKLQSTRHAEVWKARFPVGCIALTESHAGTDKQSWALPKNSIDLTATPGASARRAVAKDVRAVKDADLKVCCDTQLWHLRGVVTHKEYRNRKAGTQIVKLGLEMMEAENSQGCSALVVATPNRSAFYEKLGFEILTKRSAKLPDATTFEYHVLRKAHWDN